MDATKIRVGNGYDIHRLVKGRKLILGGVEIPFAKGLLGHSDADVLTHAICDSLLGALCFGDLGKHFPDTDKRLKDISSLTLLSKVSDFLSERGYRIINIDSVIILELPELKDYIPKIQIAISNTLNIESTCISIKAKTAEKMGDVGRGMAIETYVVTLIIKEDD